MFYIGYILLAQVQTANVIAGLAVIIALAGTIISYYAVKLSRDKFIQENKEKMASKVFVYDKISKVDADVVNVRKELDDHKYNNEREHDGLKTDIDRKLDLIIELVKSKSA